RQKNPHILNASYLKGKQNSTDPTVVLARTPLLLTTPSQFSGVHMHVCGCRCLTNLERNKTGTSKATQKAHVLQSLCLKPARTPRAQIVICLKDATISSLTLPKSSERTRIS